MSDQTDTVTGSADAEASAPQPDAPAGAFTVAATDNSAADRQLPRRSPEEIKANRRAWRAEILAKQQERRRQ